MTLSYLATQAELLNRKIHEFIKETGYEATGDVDCDMDNTPEDIYAYKNIYAYIESLNLITPYIDRLSADVTDEGILHMNENGRFSLNGREFTCGNGIEFLCEDEYVDVPYWKYSSIEAENGRYYLTASPETELEGLRVRIKS